MLIPYSICHNIPDKEWLKQKYFQTVASFTINHQIHDCGSRGSLPSCFHNCSFGVEVTSQVTFKFVFLTMHTCLVEVVTVVAFTITILWNQGGGGSGGGGSGSGSSGGGGDSHGDCDCGCGCHSHGNNIDERVQQQILQALHSMFIIRLCEVMGFKKLHLVFS